MNPSERRAVAERVLREGAELRLRVIESCLDPLLKLATAVEQSLRGGGKVLLCGNGGSAADAQHLAAEFVGRFVVERPGLPALALTTDSSTLTSIANDYGYEQVFARQVHALAERGDVVLGITTSGNSPNVLAAIAAGKARGCVTAGFSGRDGGQLAALADLCVTVPSPVTARVQELHITLGHVLCELIDHCNIRRG